jgi:hypothetical protein
MSYFSCTFFFAKNTTFDVLTGNFHSITIIFPRDEN